MAQSFKRIVTPLRWLNDVEHPPLSMQFSFFIFFLTWYFIYHAASLYHASTPSGSDYYLLYSFIVYYITTQRTLECAVAGTEDEGY